MRLTLRCIGLTTVLLLVMGAVAVAATFRGEGREDPEVRVSFEKEGRFVKGFRIREALFHCADGYSFRDGTRLGRMRIQRTRDGEQKFTGYFRNADGTQSARLRGELTSRRRAKGVFLLVAVFDRAGCDTRRVHWTARTPRE